MTITRHKSYSLPADLIAQWTQLLESTPSRPFFMQLAYQTAWWKNLGRGELEILEIKNDEQTVGLVPLYTVSIDGKKIKRIVGAMDESDYLDILVDPTKQNEVYTTLIEYWQKTANDWDEIWLECLPYTSSTPATLAANAPAAWRMTKTQQDICPGFALPATWEAYWGTLEPKNAKNFQRLLRSIGEDDVITYRCMEKPEEVAQNMATFIKLHKASEPDKRTFWTPQREAFFSEMAVALAKQKLVKLFFLDVNGDPAATLFIFDYHNQFLAYNSGFDAYAYGYLGVGNALILHAIQEGIQQGRTYFDFMRGDESYKFLFGRMSEPVFDLKISK